MSGWSVVPGYRKPLGGTLQVLSVHSFAINQQALLLLDQQKRKNGPTNILITKSLRKNLPDFGVDLRTACIPNGLSIAPR